MRGSTATQDRLNDILNKWRAYKQLLDSTHSFLTEEFPEWLQHVEQDVPDTLDEAQAQREASQVRDGGVDDDNGDGGGDDDNVDDDENNDLILWMKHRHRERHHR
jgi:hypothetical protein